MTSAKLERNFCQIFSQLWLKLRSKPFKSSSKPLKSFAQVWRKLFRDFGPYLDKVWHNFYDQISQSLKYDPSLQIFQYKIYFSDHKTTGFDKKLEHIFFRTFFPSFYNTWIGQKIGFICLPLLYKLTNCAFWLGPKSRIPYWEVYIGIFWFILYIVKLLKALEAISWQILHNIWYMYE